MKKIYLFICVFMTGMASFAQTVSNAGMETWRTGTSGAVVAKTIQAPAGWFGTDSLVIAMGQALLLDIKMSPQLFREDTIVHNGAHSAKVMTKYQDTLRYLQGTLTNAMPSFSLPSTISFNGGTPVTLKITTVSAYVAYFPGFDSATHLRGKDTGTFSVNAYAHKHGADTLIGSGFVFIPPSDTFIQITANIVYTDTVDSVGLVRIFFTSSGGATNNLDSSTLYVDDVSMTGVPEPVPPPVIDHTLVRNISMNELVKVYPNPANGTLYFDGPQNAGLNCKLFSVNGQVVLTKALTGNDALDISTLPAGFYIYAITDMDGNIMQRGKVAVN